MIFSIKINIHLIKYNIFVKILRLRFYIGSIIIILIKYIMCVIGGSYTNTNVTYIKIYNRFNIYKIK